MAILLGPPLLVVAHKGESKKKCQGHPEGKDK